MTPQLSTDSTRTNWTIVILMALGFGLVGIDRFVITTLFPVIAKDLNLNCPSQRSRWVLCSL